MIEDHHMAWRVAWRMDDAKFLTAKLQLVAFLEITVGHNIAAIGDAVARALGLNLVEQPLVIGVGADDRRACALADFRCRPRMIKVAMGEPDLLDRDAKVLCSLHQPVCFTARIHEHALHRLRGPDKRRVLLQRRHRNDADFQRRFFGGRIGHGSYVAVLLATAICRVPLFQRTR